MSLNDDLHSYIAHNYGTCSRDTCICLKQFWKGTSCKYWQPVTGTQYQELRRTLTAPNWGPNNP